MRRSKADAEQTRLKILDAAERLFCTRGIAQTTLEGIAREAGATRGAFYWHFKDKADILTAICERYKSPQLARIEAVADADLPGDALEIFETTGIEFLATIESSEKQEHLHLILLNGMPGDDTSQWREKQTGDIYRLLLRLMTRARDKGQLTPDLTPEEATISQMVLINGLIGEWLRSGKAFGLAATGAKLLPHFIAALRPPKAPPES